MMDDRKRCDGVGALFLRIGERRRRQNSGFLLCFCLLRGARGPAAVEFVRIRGRRRRPTHIASDPGGGRSTRRMLFASVHKQVSALRTSVQDWSSVYSSAGITNKFGMRHCIFMKQKSTSANSNVLFKTIQNVCLACKETGPARLGEFHR